MIEAAPTEVATKPATMKNVGKYVKGLLDLVKQAKQFSKKCAELGITPIDLGALNRQIAERMEDLPIHEDEDYLHAGLPIMFFILAGGEWWPVRHGQMTECCGSKNWLLFRIDYKDGTTESGPCKPYHWANCTADDGVNYHWFDEDLEEDPIT